MIAEIAVEIFIFLLATTFRKSFVFLQFLSPNNKFSVSQITELSYMIGKNAYIHTYTV